MATIFTRKTNSGTLRFYSDITVNGKRYRKYLGLSKKTAQQALKKLEYELRFNSPSDETEHVSYTEAVRRFLVHIELTGITYEQVKFIASKIRAFQDYCSSSGNNTLEGVLQDHCRAYMSLRSRERIKNFYSLGSEQKWKYPATSTLNRDIAIQKRFFRFCLSNDWIIKNPWSSIIRLDDKNGKNPRYSFTEDDVKMIFKNAGKFYDFYYVLLHTGIRPTDAFVLESSSFKANALTIQQNKTGDWLHSIPVPDHLIETLSDRIQRNELLFPELQTDRQRRNARKLIQSLG